MLIICSIGTDVTLTNAQQVLFPLLTSKPVIEGVILVQQLVCNVSCIMYVIGVLVSFIIVGRQGYVLVVRRVVCTARVNSCACNVLRAILSMVVPFVRKCCLLLTRVVKEVVVNAFLTAFVRCAIMSIFFPTVVGVWHAIFQDYLSPLLLLLKLALIDNACRFVGMVTHTTMNATMGIHNRAMVVANSAR